MLSAFWILTASAFMQSPVGYEMAADGRAQMNDFLAIIQNPQLWVQFPHTITAAIATGAFFIAGVSAWKITKAQKLKCLKIIPHFYHCWNTYNCASIILRSCASATIN